MKYKCPKCRRTYAHRSSAESCCRTGDYVTVTESFSPVFGGSYGGSYDGGSSSSSSCDSGGGGGGGD